MLSLPAHSRHLTQSVSYRKVSAKACLSKHNRIQKGLRQVQADNAFRAILAIGLVLISSISWGQENRYMVFFKDKVGTPYSISNPSAFLTAKSIQRRTKQGITISNSDLPITPAYIDGVKTTGVDVFYQTRWMNGVLIQGDESLIATIEALSYVDHVELVAPGVKLIPNGRYASKMDLADENFGSATTAQLSLIGLDEMHRADKRGEGMVIAVLDAGFLGVNTASAFENVMLNNQVDLSASFDFVSNQSNVFQYHDHGTRVFSTMAAFQEEVFVGGTIHANYQLYITEDIASEHRIEEYNWLFAAEKADSLGVDIITSSLGYNTFDSPSTNYTIEDMDGETTVISRAAQLAFGTGIIIVNSAGNDGSSPWGIITAPADAENVLAIGNVNYVGTRSNGSSKGPTADGRIKPDVMAMGTSTSVINSSGSLTTSSGTSLAAPLVASLVAGVRQKYPDLTNKEIIDAIRFSASQSASPDNLMGYGIPNFVAVVNYIEKNKLKQEESFIAFPNPFLETVTIRPIDPELFPSVQLRLLTSTGQQIDTRIIRFDWLNRIYQSDYSQLAAGLYLLQLSVDNRIFNFKLVKQ